MIKVILGKKGTGKTTLAKRIINQSLNKIIVLDVTGEYRENNKLTNIYDTQTLREIVENNRYYRINYNFVDEKELDIIIKTIMTDSNITVVFDEAHEVIKEKSVLRLIRYSRHLNLNLIFVSHRIYDIPTILRSQMDYICIFRMQELRDLEYLEKFLRTPPEEIRSLDKFEYIEYNINTEFFSKKRLTF
jgi:DNA helicase HerA-like ATPase